VWETVDVKKMNQGNGINTVGGEEESRGVEINPVCRNDSEFFFFFPRQQQKKKIEKQKTRELDLA
jgi:hypothetical protein